MFAEAEDLDRHHLTEVSGEAEDGSLRTTDPRMREALALRDAEPVTVILAVRDAAVEKWVREVLDEHPLVRIIAHAHDGLEATQMARELQPTACIIEAELPGIDGYETCEMIGLAAPAVAPLIVHRDEWVGGHQAAMRLGARACLTAGPDRMALIEVMTRLVTIAKRRASPEFQRAIDPAMMPNVIAVSSAKGGVGKTTIAVNLAVLMAQRYPEETILVDYYSQYGDAALMLGLEVPHNINEYAREGTDIRLPRYLQTHECGLKVLPGATEPDGRSDPLLSEEFAGRMLTTLRTKYRIIVLDLPPVLNPAALHLISRCNHFLVVCNFMELTTLRDTMLLVNSIRGNSVSGERLTLIGNRVTRQNRHLAKDLEEMTLHQVAHQLPEDIHLSLGSANSGTPLVISDPRSPLGLALRGIADQVDHGAPKEPAPVVTEPVAKQTLFGKRLAWRPLTRA